MAYEKVNGINRCLMSIDGLAGYLVAVVGLVATLGVLIYFSIVEQANNSQTYYSVNQDLHGLKMNNIENNSFRTIK